MQKNLQAYEYHKLGGASEVLAAKAWFPYSSMSDSTESRFFSEEEKMIQIVVARWSVDHFMEETAEQPLAIQYFDNLDAAKAWIARSA